MCFLRSSSALSRPGNSTERCEPVRESWRLKLLGAVFSRGLGCTCSSTSSAPSFRSTLMCLYWNRPFFEGAEPSFSFLCFFRVSSEECLPSPLPADGACCCCERSKRRGIASVAFEGLGAFAAPLDPERSFKFPGPVLVRSLPCVEYEAETPERCSCSRDYEFALFNSLKTYWA